MYWINPLSYTLYGITVQQYAPYDNVISFGGVPYTVPEFFEQIWGYKQSFQWACVGILIAFSILFRVASYFALRFLSFQSR